MNSNFDFSVPQRQSLIGVIVLFVNTLQKTIRGFWPILVVLLFKEKTYSSLQIYTGIAGLILLIAIIAFLRYWFFKFYLDYSVKEFVIENGILNKTKITIPFHKIQKVNIDQSLIQRFFKVYKLELDTAGSDGKEASINAISNAMAVELKKQLVEYTPKKSSATNPQIQDKEINNSLITIGISSLLKVGITANYIKSFVYIFIVFSTISDNLRQIGRDDLINDNINKLEQIPILSAVFGLLLFIFVAIILINVVVTVVKYYNFTVKKDNNALVLSYGLLNLKSTIIHPNKVQIIKWTQNFFQKKLNVSSIEILQASSEVKRASAKDKNKIPGCNALEMQQIITLLHQKMPQHQITLFPNFRKLLINTLLFVLVPVSIIGIVNYYVNQFTILELIGFLLPYVLFVVTILYFSYKNYRLFISDDFIVKQSGAWDIDHEIIAPYKIQAIATQQFFWQKYTNIGSVVLYTAGGRISFATTNFTKIKEQVNKWLYQVEVSTENWM